MRRTVDASGGRAALLGLALLAPQAALAGGFLAFDTAGAPVGWSTASPVAYWTDQGGLGMLSNAQATSAVEELFATWEAVPTAVIEYERAGTLSEDVTVLNYGGYLGPYGGSTVPLGKNVVVFDEDGAIFDDLYGVGTGVVGFAGPTFLSNGVTTVPIGFVPPAGSKIVEGLAFINGKFRDGFSPDLSPVDFQAAFVHELGHFSGLDHTQAHGTAHPPETDQPGAEEPYDTMHPFLLSSGGQETPERDDVVALSRLYPAPGFFASTGCAAGHILTSVGDPFTGANVVARNLVDPADFLSYVSGYNLVDAGDWSICGLRPGDSYRISVEEIDGHSLGGSRIGPFLEPATVPGPPESWSGGGESSDPLLDPPQGFATLTVGAGQTLGGVDIRLNAQPFDVLNLAYPGGSQTPTSFALGDFDRDGRLDFVATSQGFPSNKTRFSRGLGDGTFAPAVDVDSFPGNFAVVAGQFNAGVDDYLDIAVASQSRAELRLYFGDGAGGFGAPIVLLPSQGVSSWASLLAAGDFNGDPYPDLVFMLSGDFATATVRTYLGSASGTFSLVQSAIAESPRHGNPVEVGAFAGGPTDDLVFLAAGAQPRFVLLTGDDAGSFTAASVPLGAWAKRVDSDLAAGDFDEDGFLDVAVVDASPVDGPPNFTRCFIDLLRGDGQGGFALASRYSVPEPFQQGLIAVDVDGDGHLDIFSGGYGIVGQPGAKVNLALGDGAGGFRNVLSIWGVSEFPVGNGGGLAAGDFDGDGKLDLLTSDAPFTLSFHTSRISVLLQHGDLPPGGGLDFHTLTPCRLLDTRLAAEGPLRSGLERWLPFAQRCGIPPSARVLSVNATVTGATGGGHVTLYPANTTAPLASSLNFGTGQTRANNALLRLATDGTVAARARPVVLGGGTVHLILDVNGYFE